MSVSDAVLHTYVKEIHTAKTSNMYTKQQHTSGRKLNTRLISITITAEIQASTTTT